MAGLSPHPLTAWQARRIIRVVVLPRAPANAPGFKLIWSLYSLGFLIPLILTGSFGVIILHCHTFGFFWEYPAYRSLVSSAVGNL